MDKLNIKDLLSYSLESGASDLHLSVGSYPMVRINGEMKKLQLPHAVNVSYVKGLTLAMH
mgnify:CR=1 FL=1